MDGVYAQAAEMETIEQLTEDLIDFLDIAHDSKVSQPAHESGDQNPNRRLAGLQDARPQPAGSPYADQNFISFLKVTCQSDITAARTACL